VLYTPDKPIWHTDTKGAKDVRLLLQDDRNLVLYGFDGPAWASNTQTDEVPVAPPPPAAQAPAPEVVPAAVQEPAPAAEPEPAPAPRRRRLRGRTPWCVWGCAVGHFGALLRRRQQIPGDRRCQRHFQS